MARGQPLGFKHFALWIISIGVLIFFDFSSLTFASSARSGGDTAPSWQLVWSDEFNYTGAPDPSKWAFETGGGGWGNSEEQFYTDRLQNARVENGHLTIDIKKEEYESYHYTSARMHTLGDGWKYGRIDVRAKLPGGNGVWPAIWMLPTHPKYGNLGWPDNGEIDVMEHRGREPGQILGSLYSKTHIWWEPNSGGYSIYQSVPTAESEYHTYSVEWSDDTIELMVDGVTYNSFPNPDTSWEDWPYDQKYRLIINIAVGGWWGGRQIDDSALPQSLWIDYVRIYQIANLVASNR